jgi:hypothetical protein
MIWSEAIGLGKSRGPIAIGNISVPMGLLLLAAWRAVRSASDDI